MRFFKFVGLSSCIRAYKPFGTVFKFWQNQRFRLYLQTHKITKRFTRTTANEFFRNSGAGWDAGYYSVQGYTGYAYLRCRVANISSGWMVGLNDDDNYPVIVVATQDALAVIREIGDDVTLEII